MPANEALELAAPAWTNMALAVAVFFQRTKALSSLSSPPWSWVEFGGKTGEDGLSLRQFAPLSRILETLPERLALARQQHIAHQDFLLLVLADETAGRGSLAISLRVQRTRLDPAMQLELWDSTACVTYDQALSQELVSLRFLEQHKHLIIVGPVGVGKTVPRACARPYRLSSRPRGARRARRQDVQEAQARVPR